MNKYLILIITVFLTPSVTLADMNAANQALKSGDYVRAAEEFRKVAEQGNPKAQSHLGYMYYAGEGVPQSFEEAVKWYGKAAVQGDRDAQYNYAVAYAFGEGIKQDYKEAAVWYRRAAEQGHAIAQYSMGISYTYGEGVPQDEKLAAEWFMKSAEAGYENAQVMVGSLYHTGDGLPKDYAKAVTWYRKAADQGNPVAQYNLGAIYRAGKGVPQNTDEALKWYRLAAAQNYEAAKTELAALERASAGTTQEKATPPAPTAVQEQPVVAKETATVPPVEKQPVAKAEKAIETTPAPTTASVEQTVTEPVVAAESELVTAEEAEKSGGLFGKLKNIFKSDKPDEIPQTGTATLETTEPAVTAATPEPTPEPVVDEVLIEKTTPVIAEVEEPELVAAVPDTDHEISAKAEIKTELSAPAMTDETKKPIFIPGRTVTSISDLTRPRMDSLETNQGEDVITTTTAVIETPEKEAIVESVTASEISSSATTEDTKEKTGGLAGFFGRMFSRDDTETAGTEMETATEPEPETVTEVDTAETVTEEADLRGMEELQIAKADIPAQATVPIESRAGQQLETVTTGSIDILISQAVTGSPDAQFQLGNNYYDGNNVERDPVRAFLWYRRAALQGNVEAQYILGNMYLAGDGIERSDAEARNWFEMASRQEHEGARRKLENLKQSDAGIDKVALVTEQASVSTPALPARKPVEESETTTEAMSYAAQDAPAGNRLSDEVQEAEIITDNLDAGRERIATANITEAHSESADTAETPQAEEKSGGIFSFFGNLFSSDDKEKVDDTVTDTVVEESPAVAVNQVPERLSQPDSSRESAKPAQTNVPPSNEKPSAGQNEEKIAITLATPEIKSQATTNDPASKAVSAEPLKKNEIEQIRLLAEQGDVISQARLGYRYYVGEGIDQNYSEAEKWFRKSAVQGDSYAQYNLAVIHAFGEGIPQNMNEAVIWYRRAAEQDHTVAQYSLGFCYSFGEGVPRDEKTAAEWYLKSANNGYIPAQVMTGNTYHSGAGLPQDYLKAAEWYRKAADQGDAAAQYNLGTMYLLGQGVAQSDVQARNWYEKAAAQGHSSARLNLVNMQRIKEEHLASTAETVTQDPATTATRASVETAKVETQAAAVDEPQASIEQDEKSGGIFSFFGNLFSSDDKPETDESALETVTETSPAVAVEDGAEAPAADTVIVDADIVTEEELQIAKAEIPAQTTAPIETTVEKQLATLPPDSIEALTAQAVSGNPDAQLQLGRNYYQGDKVSQDLSLAFLWHRRAALQGNMEAQYTLGNMYLMGEGTAQNNAEARNWYEKAARQGHEAARHNLENLQPVIAEKPESDQIKQTETAITEKESEKGGISGLVSGLFKSEDDVEEKVDAPAQTVATTRPDATVTPRQITSTVPGQSDYERGLAYSYGDGVPQNHENAFKLFESAANLGHASAQYQIALAYTNGHGVTRNPSAAFEWYEKAARQGLTIAQRSLGNAYLNGEGVTPNKALAYAWYSILADQGNVMDIHRRDSIKNQLSESEIRESENLKQQLSASLSTASNTF